MNIYFVRHGVTSWNIEGRYQGWSDIDLTTEGLAQAWKTADYFAHISKAAGTSFKGVYSSPLRRAWRTAAAIADRLNLGQHPVPELAEMSGGVVEGLTLDQWQRLYPELIPDWSSSNIDFGWPGGETRREFAARCRRAVHSIIASHEDGDNIIVVSHGGVIMSYLEQLQLVDSSARGPFDISNCSISHVSLNSWGEAGAVGSVLFGGNARHLQELEVAV